MDRVPGTGHRSTRGPRPRLGGLKPGRSKESARVDRAGRVILGFAGVAAFMFVLLPVIGLAFAMVLLVSTDPHPEHRGDARPIVLPVLAGVLAYALAIVLSFGRGWISLAAGVTGSLLVLGAGLLARSRYLVRGR